MSADDEPTYPSAPPEPLSDAVSEWVLLIDERSRFFQAQAHGLMRTLAKYGTHLPSCALIANHEGRTCICGWDEALSPVLNALVADLYEDGEDPL